MNNATNTDIRTELTKMIRNAVTTQGWGDDKVDDFVDVFYDFLLGLYYDEKQALLRIIEATIGGRYK
jgi:hypothetical protein